MNKKFILGALLFVTQSSYSAINNKLNFKQVSPSQITVAVIDTGADINHPDLKKSIWINEGETGKDIFGHNKETNGVDDDANGFVDDVHGWNFVENNNDVSDANGHGTHIAGIINKEFHRHKTQTSQSSALSLMILKYYNPNGSDIENIRNTANAVKYANKMKARIVNYSGGGSSQYALEFKAIEDAVHNDILFIAAAGNNNMNTDQQKYYPANYPIKNIISVAASDKQGELVSFSNYGLRSVDIAAPGEEIYSTLPNNKYGFMSGTSQSTAYVTGVAARLMSKTSRASTTQSILVDLLSLSKFNSTLKGKTKFQMAMIDTP
jgi:subtilisin family serine protease